MKRYFFLLSVISGITLVLATYLFVEAVTRANKRIEYSWRLTTAVDKGNQAQVRALLAAGGDPNAPVDPPPITLGSMLRKVFSGSKPQGHGYTILMEAAGYSNAEILRILLEAGGNVHDKTSEGETALQAAVMERQHRNVELLVNYGADVKGTDVLLWAITHSDRGMKHSNDLTDILFLLAHGADPNGIDEAGDTPLMCAARWGSPEVIRTLLHAGAHIDTRNYRGQTALMSASKYATTTAILVLINEGADLSLRDQEGKTAEDIAGDSSNKQIAQVIHAARLHSGSPIP